MRKRFSWPTLGLALLLVVLIAGSEVHAVPAASLNPQRRYTFVHVDGNVLKDASGVVLKVRGVNVSGLEWDTYLSNNPWYNAQTFQDISKAGFNTVRLPFSWRFVEPTQGVINQAYLTEMDTVIGWAKAAGLYVILDFHQWMWNDNVSPGGTGMPSWVPDPCFWTNATYQNDYYAFWKLIANRYKNEGAVLGYGLMNEPWSSQGSAFVNQYLWTILSTCIDQIRTVDTSHIIIVEPYGGWDVYHIQRISKPNVVYYFSNYDNPVTQDNLDEWGQMNQIRTTWNQPVMVAEFGVPSGAQDAASWTQYCEEAWNYYQFGWFWWTWGNVDGNNMYLRNSNGSPKITLTTLENNLNLSAQPLLT